MFKEVVQLFLIVFGYICIWLTLKAKTENIVVPVGFMIIGAMAFCTSIILGFMPNV